MDTKILKFAVLLRKAGVKVSHTEVAVALKALSLTGLDNAAFFNTLAVTMIKDQSEYRVFEKVFNYFFKPETTKKLSSGVEHKPERDLFPGTEKSRTTGFGQGQGLTTAARDNFVQIIKAGSTEEMADMVKKGVKSLGRLDKEDLNDMKKSIRQVKIFLEWNMGVYQLENDSCNVDEKTRLIWQERLNCLEGMLYRELEKKLISELGETALETILARENLNELDFYKLSSPQVTEIKKRISKLAHKLASRLSLRQKRSNKGRIDLARTIRKSMPYGGVPIRPAYRDRYPTRPEFVVLCDISGSVRIFSEFMLQLVYSIQTRFIHVRSFVFVDTPDEVTAYFQDNEIEDGIKNIYNKAHFSKTAFSDYGQVFEDFNEKYLDILNKKTTLLIIGDARNNYHGEQTDLFLNMSRQVKKTIWLNPEPGTEWDREDSVMSVYSRLCDRVFECRNLKQLDQVSRNII